ncbi:MAG: alpha-L-fucosidase [Lentisphaerae bacterium]|nr:alpha-L-fucosidase [Lentisphaerota bacterium]
MAARSSAAESRKAPYGRGDTSWFRDARFGMFIHWGTYSLAARHEWVRSKEQIPQEEYQKYFDHFYPDLYNPKDWARMAREAGMRYFVITTKHHEGFCLWDSKHTGYKATKTPWGKDLLKPMVKAFRDEGIRVGFYYSLLDWHHPGYPVDCHHPQRNDAAFREREARRDVRTYAAYMRHQVTELLTQFGEVDVLWFDFSFPGKDGKDHTHWESEKLIKLVRKLQPDVVVDNRLDLPGSGDIVTPEQVQPRTRPHEAIDGIAWEACQTFSGSWGYYRDEHTWRGTDELIRTLVDCVSKDGNLLLNVGPTARGEFDHRARERLAGMGEWMKRHSRAVYGCGPAPAGIVPPQDARLTYNPKTNRLYVHLFAWPFKHVHLDGLAGKVAYAQLLHDASEVDMKLEQWYIDQYNPGKSTLTLTLPQMQPPVPVPVIELFLK